MQVALLPLGSVVAYLPRSQNATIVSCLSNLRTASAQFGNTRFVKSRVRQGRASRAASNCAAWIPQAAGGHATSAVTAVFPGKKLEAASSKSSKATTKCNASFGEAPVDEDAVQRLLKYSTSLRRFGRQILDDEELAARTRCLMRVWLTETNIRELIRRHNGGPYLAASGAKGANEAIQLLASLGLSAKQIGRCVRTNMSTAILDPDSIRQRLDALQKKLHASDLTISRAALLVALDEDTILPRIDFVMELLGGRDLAGSARARAALLGRLDVLRRREDSLLYSKQILVELVGSEEIACSMLQRRIELLITGSKLRRNWRSLCCVVGGEEAARSIAARNPSVLTRDIRSPACAARIAYWTAQLQLSPVDFLTMYCELVRYRLERLAPRWLWIQQHRPDHGLGARYIVYPDALCMGRYSSADITVPFSGFLEFKQRWLRSREGRAVCRFELPMPEGCEED